MKQVREKWPDMFELVVERYVVERYVNIQDPSSVNVDGLQEQMSSLGFSPVSQEEKSDAMMCRGSDYALTKVQGLSNFWKKSSQCIWHQQPWQSH